MGKQDKIKLHVVDESVICNKCGHIGAVKAYGVFYPRGVGDLADNVAIYEKHRNTPYLSHNLGFGGTIPYRCTNCKNCGLIGDIALEGYEPTFSKIEED